MPVAADTQQLQVHRGGAEQRVVGVALGLQVPALCGGNVPVLRLDIHMAEQIVVNEDEVALGMAAGQAAIFVKVECLNFVERSNTGAIMLDRMILGAMRGAARGQDKA